MESPGKPGTPLVLLTNDDGPSSPFFQQWLEHLRDDLRCDACCGITAWVLVMAAGDDASIRDSLA